MIRHRVINLAGYLPDIINLVFIYLRCNYLSMQIKTDSVFLSMILMVLSGACNGQFQDYSIPEKSEPGKKLYGKIL